MNNVKPRHIRELIDLPISQMTDEEIVKSILRRFKSDCVVLVISDPEMNRLNFFSRWKNRDGYKSHRQLKEAWEGKFGKFKSKMDENI